MHITVQMHDQDEHEYESTFEFLPRAGDHIAIGNTVETEKRFEVLRVWHINNDDRPWTSIKVRALGSGELPFG